MIETNSIQLDQKMKKIKYWNNEIDYRLSELKRNINRKVNLTRIRSMFKLLLFWGSSEF